jgi:hypothetical protein
MAKLYHPYETFGSTDCYTGRFLAHNHAKPAIGAFIGADLVTGAKAFKAPTVAQAAMLARTNRTYVFHALQRLALREDIEAGFFPLVPPNHVDVQAANGCETSKTFVSDADLTRVIRAVGVNRVLEAAIAVDADNFVLDPAE